MFLNVNFVHCSFFLRFSGDIAASKSLEISAYSFAFFRCTALLKSAKTKTFFWGHCCLKKSWNILTKKTACKFAGCLSYILFNEFRYAFPINIGEKISRCGMGCAGNNETFFFTARFLIKRIVHPERNKIVLISVNEKSRCF